MRPASAFTSIVILIATLLLGGCSSESNAVPSAQTSELTHVDAPHRSLVYLSDGRRSFIAVFDRDGRLVREITKGLRYPRGIFVDSRHNLWVANQGPSTILEYPRGATTPSVTLHDQQNTPDDVAVCPNGNVYVANIIGGITVYTGPKHRRSGSLDLDAAAFTFDTCDAAGNVFATGVVGSNGTVIEFPGGKESGAHLLPISSPGNLNGIKPDKADNILVSFGSTVNEYTEGGSPTGVSIQTNGDWFDIALDRAGDELLGADQSANDGVSLSFPGGKLGVMYKDAFSQVWGVAIDPN
jgi:hypothetical protein